MKKRTSLLFTIAGTIITGFAIGSFLTPNKIVGGGVSGIATILFHTLNIPTGLSNIVLNIVLLVMGLGLLGKNFILKRNYFLLDIKLITAKFCFKKCPQ